MYGDSRDKIIRFRIPDNAKIDTKVWRFISALLPLELKDVQNSLLFDMYRVL